MVNMQALLKTLKLSLQNLTMYKIFTKDRPDGYGRALLAIANWLYNVISNF